ncbi:signal recognition particle protein [Magnetospirillum sp. UT-4]|uniref:signal recognition particle protein n=1 Tax=Magnetospirillum sp. UT-4 TaxID=2681467 RepID=UPI00138414B6|nr:signal recognition particle protein [Magnetospirillum sp. UT-4]CAA7624588.1 Signal Recognition Particle (SRP) component with 4.5S RNA (ffs) [Magnetospirillum sp. UT-4]
MFDTLSQRLSKVFDKLTGRGALSEADVTEALREVRVALLEADVALPVVKDFVARVKDRAIGSEVVKSVTPGQMVVKIVHDELVATLGTEGVELNLNAVPPAVILMVGLQGSGKTTTSGKLAVRLKAQKKKVLLASLDVYRPAAQQQLEILARQADVGSLPVVMGEMPVAITRRALEMGRREGYDVVVLDTAGRLHIDQELMAEVAAVRDVAKPVETLLVTDAMTGQDAVTLAREFNEKVGVTGIVLTRVDGDARGGAALSMRHVTGRPIKFLGQGEKLDALEVFHPDRIAGRILGMGDVVSLVEKAIETVDHDEAEKLAKRIQKGKFDLEDMLTQFKQVEKMGDLKGILGMLPGIGKMAAQLKDAKIDDKALGRQKAIIQSMTPAERRNADLIKASRKRRIAAGAGVSVQDVNKLIKQYQQMADMMKKVGKMGQKGFARHGLAGLLPPGGGGFGKFGR